MIIDRIEGGYAVCETKDGQAISVPLSDLPVGAKEGDALICAHGAYEVDARASRQLRAKVQDLLRDLSK